MRPFVFFSLLLSEVLAFAGGAWGRDVGGVSYYGVYLQGNKLGYMISLRDPKAQWEGKAAVRSETTTRLSIHVLDRTTKISSRSVTWNEPKTGIPLASENRTESGGSVTTVTATYTNASVSYVADVTGTVTKDILRLKPGEKFLADVLSGAETPRIGARYKGKIFLGDPGALKLLDSEIEVAGRGPVEIGGRMVTAYRVLDKNPVAPTTLYLSDSGEMLRGDLTMGLQMRKEPKETALAPASETQQTDILALTALVPKGVPLENPRSLRLVRYALRPATHDFPTGDGVQTVTYEGAGETRTAMITVKTSPLPDSGAAPLFARAADAPERLRPFLASSVQVSSDAPEFVALAKRILSSETDSAKAAAKIAAYVHKTVTPDPAITNVRTALDIRREPRGVCRDYTLFFTAIARAAGLPTRQRLGHVYAEGRFYGHAWPEVWTGTTDEGSDRWTALEPTWGTPFADATHLALAEGEITDFAAVADLGRCEITVLEAK